MTHSTFNTDPLVNIAVEPEIICAADEAALSQGCTYDPSHLS